MEILDFVICKLRLKSDEKNRESVDVVASAWAVNTFLLIGYIMVMLLGSISATTPALFSYIGYVAIMCFLGLTWLMTAESFKENLAIPSGIGIEEQFPSLVERYNKHQYLSPLVEPSGSKSKSVKVAYIVFWVAGGLLLMAGLISMASHESCIGSNHWIRNVATAYLAALTLLMLVLNMGSYYMCCVYIWFLRELSRSNELNKLDYCHWNPSKTPLYTNLRRTAQRNTITFSLFSIACTVSFVLWTVMAGAVEGVYASLLVIDCACIVIIGIFTSLILSISSRLFLKKLLSRWEDSSLVDILNNENLPDSEKSERIKRLVSNPRLNGSDVLAIGLSVISLVVDVIAIFVSL